MTEELVLQNVFWQSSAVEREERTFGAVASHGIG